MVRIGVHPPVAVVGVAERKHVEYEFTDDLGRVQPGQPASGPVEHDDAAGVVGDHHSVGQLVGEH